MHGAQAAPYFWGESMRARGAGGADAAKTAAGGGARAAGHRRRGLALDRTRRAAARAEANTRALTRGMLMAVPQRKRYGGARRLWSS